MELEHSFTVPVPVDQAWNVLLDVERVAPCMPGATLDSVDGDEIKGRIKVKVGPISMTYVGTARFTERNRDAGVVTLEASGKEARGSGTAAATVRSELHGQDGQTEVTVHTSLNVTGRPAQFGRGVMTDISAKLIGIFATNLADMLATGNGSAPEPAVPEPAVPAAANAATPASATPVVSTQAAATPASTTPAAVPAPSEDSLNLLQVAGLPVLKRIAAPAGALLAVLAAVLIWRRRRRQ
jgi:carbon monoxide dehydrogenase subunit G